MAQSSIVACTCGSVGNKNGIRFCAKCHRYWNDDTELASVSSVIRDIYPKHSWDKADPAKVAHAKERGIRVDRYLTEYLSTGRVTMNPGEWREVQDRFDMVTEWCEKNLRGRVESQVIVYSTRDGVAGTADIRISDTIIDLKNTWSIEKSYALQMGAYGEYGDAANLHVLQVKQEGIRLVPFDRDYCTLLWRQGVGWWKSIKELERTA